MRWTIAIWLAGCGVVEPLSTGRESIDILIPHCEDLQCDAIEQWSYTENGVSMLRVFCRINEPPDETCSDVGCLTVDPGIECKFNP